VRQGQIAIREAAVRQRRDRVGERLTGVVGRPIVGDDDLRAQCALAEVLRACGEARRDAASLVIGRKDQ
jgi:hypothetical protein